MDEDRPLAARVRRGRLGIEVVEIEEEFVGVDRSTPSGSHASGGKSASLKVMISSVGGGEDVSILRVVRHRGFEALDLGGVNFGFFEGCVHRLRDSGGLLIRDLALGEVASHLLEDSGAPERPAELELGEPKQGVAEREGVEDVGVEDGAEDHGGARLTGAAGNQR